MNKNILTWKNINFYSPLDEVVFFEWIKKIDCIDDIKRENNSLFFYIASDEIHDYNLRDLLALFFRYHIDMKQLKRFLMPENKKWFKNKIAYWHDKVFKEIENND
jgi:hypothetical protein